MKNKLLNNYLLSYYIVAALFLGLAGVSAVFAEQETRIIKQHIENKDIVDSGNSTYSSCMLLIIISLIMATFCGVIYPRNAQKKADIITQHYLQEILVSYPGMKKYYFILKDPKKLREIASVICNGLTEDEQAEILRLVTEELNQNNPSGLKRIENIIKNIVQQHATKDPKYMENILAAIMNTQKADFMQSSQKTR